MLPAEAMWEFAAENTCVELKGTGCGLWVAVAV